MEVIRLIHFKFWTKHIHQKTGLVSAEFYNHLLYSSHQIKLIARGEDTSLMSYFHFNELITFSAKLPMVKAKKRLKLLLNL